MRSSLISSFLGGWLLVLFSCSLSAKPLHHADIDPEADTGSGGIKRSQGQYYMAVTANAHATAAATEILAAGGSAVDAAIAAQLVLTLVEPQSSGIGGGAFLMHWNNGDKQLQLFDGRETAPAAVDENHFLSSRNKPLSYMDVLIGGYSVGTPGVVQMMAMAHQQHGQLPWESLFSPAIKLSQEGFQLSPRLHGLLVRFNQLMDHPTSRAYFYQANGKPKAIGSLLKNPSYAKSLELISTQGSKAFYQGELAAAISGAVQGDKVLPGKLSTQDIAAYQALVRLPLCADYRQYRVCTTPPPSSGATVLQILGTLEQLPAPQPQAGSIDWVHRFAEASRLSFADRDNYIADPDFVEVPVPLMIDPDYLKKRASLISLKRAARDVEPGKLEPLLTRIDVGSPEFPSTTHLSIVDGKGNAVSMTSSVQMAFGSGIMVGGFLLNNQLTDFSFVPKGDDKQWVANRIEPGKRPRSSMSPTIVFKDDRPVMLIGSPGGSRIIDYVARVIAYHLAADIDIAQAVALPNIVHMNRNLELEAGGFSDTEIERLTAMGHKVVETSLNSGLHGISLEKNTIIGGADPRREGVAAGR